MEPPKHVTETVRPSAPYRGLYEFTDEQKHEPEQVSEPVRPTAPYRGLYDFVDEPKHVTEQLESDDDDDSEYFDVIDIDGQDTIVTLPKKHVRTAVAMEIGPEERQAMESDPIEYVEPIEEYDENYTIYPKADDEFAGPSDRELREEARREEEQQQAAQLRRTEQARREEEQEQEAA